jgi:hypothetical protein
MTDIAFLIIAHKNERQLQRLVHHLSSDFAVYLHLDRKSAIDPANIANAVVSTSRVEWGGYSLIRATLQLLTESSCRGHDRYVLISGQDLPLVSNRDINAFFEGSDSEYIEWEKLPRAIWPPKGGYDRLELFWEKASAPIGVKVLGRAIRECQKRLGLCRPLGYEYFGGTAWFSITDESARYILDYVTNTDKNFLRSFRLTRAADEIFFQTILLNSRYALRCVNSSLHFIDWNAGTGHPRVLTLDDLQALTASKELFARKFDEEIDSSIIDAIYERMGERKASLRIYRSERGDR